MLIAILSDLHDCWLNLDLCLNWCQRQAIDKIIFCGDLTRTGTLHRFAQGFTQEILLVRGNAELYPAKALGLYPHIKNFGSIGQIELDGLAISFCHEPDKIKIIRQQKGSREPRFIFYGHSHRPWLKQDKNSFVINPGALSGPSYQASFALLNTDTGKVELKILANL